MKRFSAIVILACVFQCSLFSENRTGYRGFIGGMMLHTGYVAGQEISITSLSGVSQTVPISGAPFGVGGAIRFMFGRHLRIGGEGYVSNLKYGSYGSKATTGWGGVLADCAWSVGRRSRVFVGGTIGGGSQTNTTILSEIKDDYIAEECISYRKYGFMALAPFAGYEFALNGKMSLVCKVDWLLSLTPCAADFVTGPRLYLGFMFGHSDPQ